MYYILDNNTIVLYDNDKEKIENTLKFMPQYEGLEILETDKNIVEFNNAFYFKDEIKDELEQAEKERIAKLFLTGADVERGIYQAKGMDFDDIIQMLGSLEAERESNVNQSSELQNLLPSNFDIKALKIELKANNFYRGNPYVSAIGTLLGFTSEQLDKFFEDGNYEHLLV